MGLEFSADGSALFVAEENRGIAEVDLLSGSVGRSQRTEERVRAFDVSPDGRWIVWAGDDGMVELLNSRFRRQDVFESPNLYRRRLAFTAFGIEGSEVFAASRDNARSAFWALGEDDPIRRDERNREEYTAFATDHDGELLVLAVKTVRLERSAASRGAIAASAGHVVRILDWNRGRVVREIEALPDDIRAVAVSPDRSMVAIAFDNGDMEGYSTQENRQIMSIHDGDRVNVAQFSPSGGWLAAGLDREGVLIWEMSGS